MMQRMLNLLAVLLLCAAAFFSYDLIRTRDEAGLYRQQLADLNDDYAQLRGTYNQVVARTAVTELLVEDGRVNVVVRTAEGEIRRVETPFKCDGEIYVDYVIVGNRLWIRRVFDDRTPPADAVVITPSLKDVDWDADHAVHGKAVYRQLAEGRWVITVTGDGSLGLARAEPHRPIQLASPPRIRDYQPIAEQ